VKQGIKLDSIANLQLSLNFYQDLQIAISISIKLNNVWASSEQWRCFQHSRIQYALFTRLSEITEAKNSYAVKKASKLNWWDEISIIWIQRHTISELPYIFNYEYLLGRLSRYFRYTFLNFHTVNRVYSKYISWNKANRKSSKLKLELDFLLAVSQTTTPAPRW
jgi:hypothetical protein